MTTLKEKAERLLELDKQATPEPWIEREDYDYYQGGTYLGVGPYSYVGGKKIKPNGCVFFKKDVCRIEGDDSDKNFIAESRTIAPELAKAYLRMREVLEWYGLIQPDCTEQCKAFEIFTEGSAMLIEAIHEYGERARAALEDTK